MLILESHEIQKCATFIGSMCGLLLKHVVHIITTMFQKLKLLPVNAMEAYGGMEVQ